MKQYTIIFLIALVSWSCGSSKKIVINSTPEDAEVYLYDQTEKKTHLVGKTPLVIDKNIETISKELWKQDVWTMTIEKKGHVIENLVFNRKYNPEFEILLNLKEIAQWPDTKSSVYSEMADRIAKTVQKVNRDIEARKYDQALSLLEELNTLYPQAAMFYDIKGSVYLLMDRKNEALASYKKSLSINPDNSMTQKMLKSLEQKK